MSLEVERKFLLHQYPDDLIADGTLEVISLQHIDQTYLALAEGEELRLRRVRNSDTLASEYILTYKSGFGLVRKEIEHPVTKQLYDELLSITRLKPLHKDRTTARIKDTGLIIEIDRYRHTPLIVVEVEFPDEQTAHQFQPPSWFGKDISTNRAYSNKELWRQINHITK